MSDMRISLLATTLLLVLTGTHSGCLSSNSLSLSPWIKDLRSATARVLKTEVRVGLTIERDNIEEKDYPVVRLEGEGSLVVEPFSEIKKMFVADGWVEDTDYTADSHGSGSFAYRKGHQFCIILIDTDSSCDDEETGHIPGKFEFSIDCRDISVGR